MKIEDVDINVEGVEAMKGFYRKAFSYTLAIALTGLALLTPTAIAADSVHVVKKGESLWTIARQYDLQVNELAKLNDIQNDDHIESGVELNLGYQIYQAKLGESLWTIAKKFDVSHQKLIQSNHLKNPNYILVGTDLKIPVIDSQMRKSSSIRSVQNNLAVIWPVRGRISSPFGSRWGRMHWGIDIAVPVGRNIVAAAAGKVVWSGWVNGYGQTVIIDHGNGYRTLYAHNNRLIVRPGDNVRQAQLIAKSGNSGNSTGPHLHFEIQKDGQAIDPMNFLR